MKANYVVQEGDLRIIRPFVYVREKQLRDFAEKEKLPVIAENCPAVSLHFEHVSRSFDDVFSLFF